MVATAILSADLLLAARVDEPQRWDWRKGLIGFVRSLCVDQWLRGAKGVYQSEWSVGR